MHPPPNNTPGGPASSSETNLEIYAFSRLVFYTSALLELPVTVACTACIYFRKFYQNFSLEDYDPHLMLQASVLLASKIHECPRRIRDIVTVAFHLRHSTDGTACVPSNSEYWQQKPLLVEMEHHLLRALRFQTETQLPHEYVLPLARHFELENHVAATAFYFCNDMFVSPAGVQHSAEILAVAAIHLAIHLYEGRSFGDGFRLHELADSRDDVSGLTPVDTSSVRSPALLPLPPSRMGSPAAAPPQLHLPPSLDSDAGASSLDVAGSPRAVLSPTGAVVSPRSLVSPRNGAAGGGGIPAYSSSSGVASASYTSASSGSLQPTGPFPSAASPPGSPTVGPNSSLYAPTAPRPLAQQSSLTPGRPERIVTDGSLGGYAGSSYASIGGYGGSTPRSQAPGANNASAAGGAAPRPRPQVISAVTGCLATKRVDLPLSQLCARCGVGKEAVLAAVDALMALYDVEARSKLGRQMDAGAG